jgi:hypothetical protein
MAEADLCENSDAAPDQEEDGGQAVGFGTIGGGSRKEVGVRWAIAVQRPRGADPYHDW